MEYRNFGNTGLKVSIISIGTMIDGKDTGAGEANDVETPFTGPGRRESTSSTALRSKDRARASSS